MDFEAIARQAAAGQDESDDSDCACQPDTSHPRPGDGAAEVTMTAVYDIDIPRGHHPSGW